MREAQSSRPFGLAVERSADRRPLVTAKDVLWLVYLYPLRFLAAVLPIPMFRVLTSVVDFVCQRVTGRLKRSMLKHLDAVQESGGLRQDPKTIASQIVSRSVRRSMDDLVLNRLVAQGLKPPQIEGLEHLEQAVARGKGVILLSAHTYANRVSKRYLDQAGFPVMSIRNHRPPDSLMGQLGKRLLHHRYLEHLHGIIQDEAFIQDASCALTISKRLRAGGIVHIYLDAGVTALRSSDEDVAMFWAPFLATQRPFPTGFMRIARATGCALVPLICLGDSLDFSIACDAPLELSPDAATDELIAAHLPGLVAAFETKILKAPEQWELWGIFERSYLTIKPRGFRSV